MFSPWRLSTHHGASRRTGLPLQIPLLTYNALRPGFTAYCGSRLTALETVLHWNVSHPEAGPDAPLLAFSWQTA